MKLLKNKSTILSNLFSEEYGLNLGEFNNTTGTERAKIEFPVGNNLVIHTKLNQKDLILQS